MSAVQIGRPEPAVLLHLSPVIVSPVAAHRRRPRVRLRRNAGLWRSIAIGLGLGLAGLVLALLAITAAGPVRSEAAAYSRVAGGAYPAQEHRLPAYPVPAEPLVAEMPVP